MHFYQFHIGDYASHTAHLDPIEDIAYRRMIDWCYLHESGLPESVEEIARIIRMREHCKCIATVLQEFFTLENGAYTCARVEQELKSYKEVSKKRKKAANARWASKHKGLKGDASALQTECKSNANHEPITNNHKPINTPLPPTGGSQVPDCPHIEIIQAYHETLPELQSVIVDRWQGSARARDLQARWRESKKHQSVEFWRRYFAEVRNFPHQMGENDRGWKADLGWLIKRSNFDKMIERMVARGQG